MTYRTFCSGIGAPETAWASLGWRCLSASEIEPAACAVLAARHTAPNVGDMTTCTERMSDESTDLVVGGTPCQSFSVAGLRRGLADPRGNLALVYLAVVERLRPRWVVWENVPGVLSSNRGRDFGAFLGALVELGYGFAYRVLDAQYVRVDTHARAVPQRRRRVFVVGHLGDWRRAAKVLLERASLCGHPPPRREAGSDVATALTRGLGSGGADAARAQAGWIQPVCGSLTDGAHCGGGLNGQDAYTGRLSATHSTLDEGQTVVAFAHQAGGTRTTLGYDPKSGTCQTLVAHQTPAIAFTQNQTGDVLSGDVIPAMGTNSNASGRNTPKVMHNAVVRRLTPRECERLQGFPDDYTLVEYRGKPMSDSARYRMLGNSMAVNVMRWIGQRIAAVDAEVAA